MRAAQMTYAAGMSADRHSQAYVLRGRAAARRRRMRLARIRRIVFSSLLLIMLITSLTGFSRPVQVTQPVYKYYAAVSVERGETLWSIAESYYTQDWKSMRTYVKESSRLNHIGSGQVKHGQTLVVPYYSTQQK